MSGSNEKPLRMPSIDLTRVARLSCSLVLYRDQGNDDLPVQKQE